ncbi:cytochrome P450 [Schizophyllum commune]
MLEIASSLKIVLCGVGAALLAVVLLRRRRSLPLPPGPPSLPIIGGLLSMPSEKEWLTFARWGRKYGDICSVSVLSQTMIIINSPRIATDLLDRRSAIYSDRPSIAFGGDFVGWSRTTVLLPYGARHRASRRLMQQVIGTQSAVHKFDEIEEIEIRKFLNNLLDTPEDFAEHVRHMTGSIILRISYGYHALPREDPFIKLANEATEQFALATSPGGFLANLVPPLLSLPDWSPGAGFKSIGRAWRETLDRMADLPYAFVKSQLSGGADTTVASIDAFIRFMTTNPDVQARAQAEVDDVIGTDRLPSMQDRPHLPYVNALALEVLRSHVVVPTGAPHRGYFIPKGSLIMPVLWSMLHDERTYRHSMEFWPDRFLATEGRQPEKDPRTICFGFGRRICPGRELADISLLFACASILSVFEIGRCKESGVEVGPVEGETSGSIRYGVTWHVGCN